MCFHGLVWKISSYTKREWYSDLIYVCQSAAVIISSWPLVSSNSLTPTSLEYFEINLNHYNKGNCIFDCLQILVLRLVTGINNGADN